MSDVMSRMSTLFDALVGQLPFSMNLGLLHLPWVLVGVHLLTTRGGAYHVFALARTPA